MKFLGSMADKVAALFKSLQVVAQKVEALAADHAAWERRLGAVQEEQRAAQSRLEELQDQELDGRPDPDGLAAARTLISGLGERINIHSRRILNLYSGVEAAAVEELSVRHRTASDRLCALEAQRTQVLPILVARLAEVISLRDQYWPVGKSCPFEITHEDLPDLDGELARLATEKPGQGFLAALQAARDDLERTPGSTAAANFVNVRVRSALKKAREAS